MFKIHIISVGKLSKELEKVYLEYKKMLNWSVEATEITYSKKLLANQLKQFEAKKILEYLNPKAYKIALDVEGKTIDSHEFSKLFMFNQKIDFIIGGAFGLDMQILDIVDMQISLSKMTFPHQLAKIILMEQIYRAQTLINKHPYHK